MKKKLAIGGAALIAVVIGAVLVVHMRHPEWFVRPLVEGLSFRAASDDRVVVVAVEDLSVEPREVPSTPMVIEKLDINGGKPVVLAHVSDVVEIAVTRSHVFFTLHGLLRPVTSIQVVPIGGGEPREIGTSPVSVKLAAAGHRVWWVEPKGAIFAGTAAGDPPVALGLDPIRCMAAAGSGVIAATSTSVLRIDDLGTYTEGLVGGAFDGCSLVMVGGVIRFASWTTAGGSIRSLWDDHWETLVDDVHGPVLLGGMNNYDVFWVEKNTTVYRAERGGKPKRMFALDGIIWFDIDDRNRVVFQSIEGQFARVVW